MLADRSFEHHSKICPALAALGADISRQTNEIVAALARERITCNGRTTPDGLIDTFQNQPCAKVCDRGVGLGNFTESAERETNAVALFRIRQHDMGIERDDVFEVLPKKCHPRHVCRDCHATVVDYNSPLLQCCGRAAALMFKQ